MNATPSFVKNNKNKLSYDQHTDTVYIFANSSIDDKTICYMYMLLLIVFARRLPRLSSAFWCY